MVYYVIFRTTIKPLKLPAAWFTYFVVHLFMGGPLDGEAVFSKTQTPGPRQHREMGVVCGSLAGGTRELGLLEDGDHSRQVTVDLDLSVFAKPSVCPGEPLL